MGMSSSKGKVGRHRGALCGGHPSGVRSPLLWPSQACCIAALQLHRAERLEPFKTHDLRLRQHSPGSCPGSSPEALGELCRQLAACGKHVQPGSLRLIFYRWACILDASGLCLPGLGLLALDTPYLSRWNRWFLVMGTCSCAGSGEGAGQWGSGALGHVGVTIGMSTHLPDDASDHEGAGASDGIVVEWSDDQEEEKEEEAEAE